MIVKEWILPLLKVHETKQTDLATFFTLSEVLYRDVLLEGLKGAVVYIPPYGSMYASDDPFLETQEGLLNLCSKSTNNDIVIFGDFNARCSNVPDYIQLDSHVSNANGLQDLYEENTTTLSYFEKCHIPLARNTAD